MAIVPDTIDGTLNWATDHIATWDAVVTAGAGSANGLDTADITALQTALTAADTGRSDAIAARSASQAATLTQNTNLDSLRDEISLAIKKIKTFADGSATPNTVYAEMEIPAPDTNPTKHFPVQPTALTATPDASGNVLFTWDGGANAYGTIYEIEGSSDGSVWNVVESTKKQRVTVPGFTPGATHWFRVTASNNGQTSVPSETVAIWGPGASAPLSIAA